jgi:hypothetical protein
MEKKLSFASWELECLMGGFGRRSPLAAMHFRIFNQKVRNCCLGLFVGYGWFVVVAMHFRIIC